MINQWIFNSLTPEQEEYQTQITEVLGVSPVLTKLLVQRGVNNFEEAKKFFRPVLNDLHDPFLIKDMDRAVERLNKALAKKEKILIYGDYDVDGTTAVALVYMFLSQFTTAIDFYIPDRYTEGYGISYKSIDFAHENKFSLIIALDCGIKAVDKVAYAKEKNIDFIICDHHTPDDILPNAIAVLDSKRIDCTYPYKHLSGCGVGFKFMQAFAQNNGLDFASLKPFLDLVAVSIACDIVPITGENRILAYYGLKQLSENPSVGLKGIIDVCNLSDKELTVSDVVFKIGPRINASGRMGSGHEVVELLTSHDATFAKERSMSINDYNDDRRNIDKQTTDEAKNIIINNLDLQNRRSIVIYNETWSKGIVGIVASRLCEEFYKPTIVLTKANGFISGSARSVQGFDLYSAIDSCRDLLENFGGHMYAAGLTMKEENLDEFTRRFEEYVVQHIQEDQLVPQIEIDAEVKFSDLTPKFFRILKQFSPFGPGNMKPVFCTRRVFDYEGNSRPVGREQEHLKLELVDSSCENVMNGIAFRMSDYNDHLKALNPLDICYTIEENTFNNNTTIQLMIRDIQLSTQ
ncbi:MAG TPA: single-stranded-DNA-specific exonuclease RecJ [Paludibacteraceae bacterium]|nr:single-stranded-DNA-specific exonuclease RecJ [Paludibacteraceae bacterium]HQB68647.1 single-stranded-DNA-specific exonuclease RecJ [Paludibacteraceae bacterium]HRS68094.1 single-stranded-DNA-specific exonuclease RecJ [Paludibacteraceae bacterium]